MCDDPSPLAVFLSSVFSEAVDGFQAGLELTFLAINEVNVVSST